ncbi:immunoglobulin superfamily member 3-like [Pelobates fuscus]|uniref:immunoglobulin superfamily member 3-like n=1 Tax=Pelobates fuscus TaxID=191477 RepID=UPI002FE4E565
MFLYYRQTDRQGGLAQHQVGVPPGPLVRMEGSAIFIWCNASGVSRTEFEWSLFPSHSPSWKLQVISSSDPHFTYALYSERVQQRREIYLERGGENTARLHITHLRAWDSGDYECHTPNTAQTFYGSYSANVYLKVIPDMLRVQSLSPDILTVEDDDPLSLVCEVFSGTSLHTHISVTWYQMYGDESRPILSLSKHSVVSAGPGFTVRHSTGEVRLEKVSAAWYQLTLTRLKITDEAEYWCQVTEWIQDPDNSWYPLMTKRSSATTIQLRSQGTPLGEDMMSAVRSSTTPITTPQIVICLLALLYWPIH